ncbi:MAG: tRNA (guanosine(37)-N1)-methyltransferase TrmD [Patescibacteria group bacterium]
MTFDIITIFPKIFNSYFNESIVKRARAKKLIDIRVHDLRDYAKHKKSLPAKMRSFRRVDDTPYGGGAGMVMMAEPILRAVDAVVHKNKNNKTKIVLFSAKGKSFNQKIAHDWSKKYNRIVFVTGRYEGIDERATQILKKEYKKDFEEISIGPYVLTDGDVAAMIVISAVSRLIPGAIRMESLQEESHWNMLLKTETKKLPTTNYKLQTTLEYPHYTRPEVLIYKSKKYSVPKVLLSGNHKKIAEWRKSHCS